MGDPTEKAITVLMSRGVHVPDHSLDDMPALFRRRRLIEGYAHETRLISRIVEALINAGLNEGKAAADSHRMVLEEMWPIRKSMEESMERAREYMDQLEMEELKVGVSATDWYQGRPMDSIFGQWEKVNSDE